eukprot:364241-Chlamydomonas_euryale.AAC.16
MHPFRCGIGVLRGASFRCGLGAPRGASFRCGICVPRDASVQVWNRRTEGRIRSGVEQGRLWTHAATCGVGWRPLCDGVGPHLRAGTATADLGPCDNLCSDFALSWTCPSGGACSAGVCQPKKR